MNIFNRILEALVSNVLPFVLILAVGILIIRAVLRLVNRMLERSHMEKAAHGLIRSLLQAVLYLVLGLIAASALGIDVTGVIALASVLTLAVSLSVQNLLTNIIGGFTLLYTKPFKSGDYVDIGEESGTVQEISMTYTKLITSDNKLICIPNSSVVEADIVNYSATGTRRVEIKVTASYDAAAGQVIDALLEAAGHPGVLVEPAPFAAVNGYGDSAVEYTLRMWVKTENYWDVYFEVNRKIRECFEAKGIEMTYPHLNVHMDRA